MDRCRNQGERGEVAGGGYRKELSTSPLPSPIFALVGIVDV